MILRKRSYLQKENTIKNKNNCIFYKNYREYDVKKFSAQKRSKNTYIIDCLKHRKELLLRKNILYPEFSQNSTYPLKVIKLHYATLMDNFALKIDVKYEIKGVQFSFLKKKRYNVVSKT